MEWQGEKLNPSLPACSWALLRQVLRHLCYLPVSATGWPVYLSIRGGLDVAYLPLATL